MDAISWPLYTPDLTILYFSFVGYIKDQVYVLPLPAMLENLKDRK
jgi:hypothetical protein